MGFAEAVLLCRLYYGLLSKWEERGARIGEAAKQEEKWVHEGKVGSNGVVVHTVVLHCRLRRRTELGPAKTALG